MDIKEFVQLAEEEASQGPNIRIYKKWAEKGTSICFLPDEVLRQFPSIIALLQKNIDKGQLISREQYILIYNFQPIYDDGKGNVYYCGLDMLVKPIKEIKETDALWGVPLHLTVNVRTGEVLNSAKGFLEISALMGLGVAGAAEEQEEPLISYGNYKDKIYNSPKELNKINRIKRSGDENEMKLAIKPAQNQQDFNGEFIESRKSSPTRTAALLHSYTQTVTSTSPSPPASSHKSPSIHKPAHTLPNKESAGKVNSPREAHWSYPIFIDTLMRQFSFDFQIPLAPLNL